MSFKTIKWIIHEKTIPYTELLDMSTEATSEFLQVDKTQSIKVKLSDYVYFGYKHGEEVTLDALKKRIKSRSDVLDVLDHWKHPDTVAETMEPVKKEDIEITKQTWRKKEDIPEADIELWNDEKIKTFVKRDKKGHFTKNWNVV